MLSVLASLPSAENYTQRDRYHDFRRIFMGSEEGKRVFREILSWGHILRPSSFGSPIDPYLTHVRDGEANIARRLLVTVTNEPPEKPVQAKRKQEK